MCPLDEIVVPDPNPAIPRILPSFCTSVTSSGTAFMIARRLSLLIAASPGRAANVPTSSAPAASATDSRQGSTRRVTPLGGRRTGSAGLVIDIAPLLHDQMADDVGLQRAHVRLWTGERDHVELLLVHQRTLGGEALRPRPGGHI